jgi:hypothetical protein
VIAFFSLDETDSSGLQFELFKQAHATWVDRINRMVDHKEDIHIDDLANHTNCVLGKCITNVEKRIRKIPEYKAIEELTDNSSRSLTKCECIPSKSFIAKRWKIR